MKKLALAVFVLFCFTGRARGADYAKMGETLEVQPGLFLTLNSARFTDKGNMNPENGRFLIFDCTFENKSNSPISVSTIMNLFIQDSEGFKYTISVRAQTKGSLDGMVRNGAKLRGEIGFDVSAEDLIEFFGFKFLMGKQESIWRVDLRANSVVTPERYSGKEVMAQIVTTLGIDANSRAYKEYAASMNQLVKTNGFDIATVGLILIDDYKTFLEDGKSFIDWSMIR